MTDVKIPALPAGVTLTGAEMMEAVQAGVSVKIPASYFPSIQMPFITLSPQPTLPNSRGITAGVGITFVDTGPGGTLTIVATGTVAGPATPTALVGLTAVSGAALTYTRSDGAPALDQGIAPTWTGAHTFSIAPRPLNNTIDLGLTGTRWGTIYGTNLTLTNPVSAINGGTGQAVYAVGDILYASTTTALSRLADVAAGSYLGSGGVGAAPVWSTIASLGANPTGTVGLAAVNGVATTYLRSDGAPPLSQAIAPTWSGQHKFSLTNATGAIQITTTVPILTMNETAAASGARLWRQIVSSSAMQFDAADDTASTVQPWLTVSRTGANINTITQYTGAGVARLTINSTGNITIAAPSSGIGLTVTAAAATASNSVSIGGSTTGRNYLSITNTSGFLLAGVESSTGGGLFTGAPAYATAIGSNNATDLSIGTNSIERIRVNSAGNVTINAPSSGTLLTVNGGSIQTGKLTIVGGAGIAGGLMQEWITGGTTQQYMTTGNTGGGGYMGVESSTGSALATGTAAYSSIFGSYGATSTSLISNSVNRLTINSTGNVTINAPSSGNALTVTGIGKFSTVGSAGATAINLEVNNEATGNAGNATAIHLGYSLASFYGYRLTNTNDPGSTAAGTFAIQRGDGATTYTNVLSSNNSGAVTIAAPAAGVALSVTALASETLRNIGNTAFLSFYDATNTTRSGYLQMPSTSGASLLVEVNQSLTLGTNSAARLIISSAGNVRFAAYGAGTLQTDASGNITAVSDERVKSSIRPYSAGLTEILGIRPIMHGYSSDSGLDQTKKDYAGFSAQNIRSVMPEAVDTSPDGRLSLSDRPIIAALVNSIKQLESRTRHLS